MKPTTFSKQLTAVFGLVSFSFALFTGCAKAGDGETITSYPVDEYSISRASSALCTTDTRLRASTDVLTLNLDHLQSTGQAKAVTFLQGDKECAIYFTSYDIATRTNKVSGTVQTTTTTGAPLNYNYEIQLPNSDPGACVPNGSAWQILSTVSTNTPDTQIVLKNLRDTQSPSLVLVVPKTLQTGAFSTKIGMTSYTCR